MRKYRRCEFSHAREMTHNIPAPTSCLRNGNRHLVVEFTFIFAMARVSRHEILSRSAHTGIRPFCHLLYMQNYLKSHRFVSSHNFTINDRFFARLDFSRRNAIKLPEVEKRLWTWIRTKRVFHFVVVNVPAQSCYPIHSAIYWTLLLCVNGQKISLMQTTRDNEMRLFDLYTTNVQGLEITLVSLYPKIYDNWLWRLVRTLNFLWPSKLSITPSHLLHEVALRLSSNINKFQ